jgi:hypothetical protein
MTQQNNRSSPATASAASAGGPAPTAGEVKDQVKDAAGQAKEMAGQAVEQAQETVGKVVDQAKAQTTSRLADQKERAAGGLGTVAQALRQTGQGLRDQEQDVAGRYADGIAQQVERFADYLRAHDVAELLDDVEEVARRQPGLFLGGAVALGFLGSRFLMSSGRRAARRERALAGAPAAGGNAMLPYRPQPAAGVPVPAAPAAPAAPGAYRPDAGRPASAPGATAATGMAGTAGTAAGPGRMGTAGTAGAAGAAGTAGAENV